MDIKENKLDYDNQKEKLLSLFNENMQKSIIDKHLTIESMTHSGKEIHVIYIADDAMIKEIYKNLISQGA
jgi:hypothetical protein